MTIITICNAPVRCFDGLYSLNDLHKSSGGESRHQPTKFMRLDQTKALIAELVNYPEMVSFKTTTGRLGGTYVCRELVYAYANWISAAFYLKMIRAFDEMQGVPKVDAGKTALPAPVTLTIAQVRQVTEAVRGVSGWFHPSNGQVVAAVYGCLHREFGIERIEHLPSVRLPECLALVAKMTALARAEVMLAERVCINAFACAVRLPENTRQVVAWSA